MSSENLRQRIRDEPNTDDARNDDYNNNNYYEERRQGRRTTMARHEFRSLTIDVAVPVLLHLGRHLLIDRPVPIPVWMPFNWVIQPILVGPASIMGFCGWLFWVDGTFTRQLLGLAFALGYLAMNLAWDPIVLGYGAFRARLVVSVATSVIFKESKR